jgi:hypothetical protein
MLQSDLETAIDVKTESSTVDYKSAFDTNSAADWLEVVKDIIAMSNSGGGLIIFGIADDGNLSAFDCSVLNALDPATVTDKIYRYTGKQFDAFRFLTSARPQRPLFAIVVRSTDVPIVFSKPGTYDVGAGRQKTAFSAGTVYFRHGAKSEPGNSDDLRIFLEGRIEQMRKAWFEGIVKVVEAPPGSEVQVTSPQQAENQSANIRLVNDPAAPAYRPVSIDDTHPHRQKEVIEEFNKATNGTKKITSFHVQCVRHVHRVDENPTFYCRMKHSSPRYSQAFVDWLVEQYGGNSDFFEETKRRAREGAQVVERQNTDGI